MKIIKYLFILFFIILLIGFVIPQNLQMPVDGAGNSDFNKDSFWYYPWGKSVTHKGVDIFAKKGTSIHSATKGLVLYVGEIKYGGKIVVILGPQWRIHYYAHLDQINTKQFNFVNQKVLIGKVGDSGNATGKAPHLHYSIITPIPYVWRIDLERQGWKKMFYLNPISYL